MRRLSIAKIACCLWLSAVPLPQVISTETLPRKVIISDLHLGAGQLIKGTKNPLEDFRFDAEFCDFMNALHDAPTQLIIAGDFIDFFQILPDRNLQRAHPPRVIGSTVDGSMAKLKQAIAGHPLVFKALTEFLSYFRANNIVIIPGNHDVDLTWKDIQEELRNAVGVRNDSKVFVAVGGYRDHNVWVEHGHQYDILNRFGNPDRPWKAVDGIERLETNWGTEFVELIVN